MNLKMRTKETYFVDWNDLAKELIKLFPDSVRDSEYFKGRWELLEANNDTDYAVDVKEETIEYYDQDTIKEMLRTGQVNYYQLHLLMTFLCNNKHINPGSYVISISW